MLPCTLFYYVYVLMVHTVILLVITRYSSLWRKPMRYQLTVEVYENKSINSKTTDIFENV